VGLQKDSKEERIGEACQEETDGGTLKNRNLKKKLLEMQLKNTPFSLFTFILKPKKV